MFLNRDPALASGQPFDPYACRMEFQSPSMVSGGDYENREDYDLNYQQIQGPKTKLKFIPFQTFSERNPQMMGIQPQPGYAPKMQWQQPQNPDVGGMSRYGASAPQYEQLQYQPQEQFQPQPQFQPQFQPQYQPQPQSQPQYQPQFQPQLQEQPQPRIFQGPTGGWFRILDDGSIVPYQNQPTLYPPIGYQGPGGPYPQGPPPFAASKKKKFEKSSVNASRVTMGSPGQPTGGEIVGPTKGREFTQPIDFMSSTCESCHRHMKESKGHFC
jgi:hypothetical protein